MKKLIQTIQAIAPPEKSLNSKIKQHLDSLTKPQGSLGKLEDLVTNYCLMTNAVQPHLGEKRIILYAADHGVAASRVSAYPQEVTTQMVLNILSGGAAVNVLARHVGAELTVVDIGVAHTFSDAPQNLVHRKVGLGTANFIQGPAMSEQEVYQALEIGIELAEKAKDEEVTLLGTGEMGIGNTTSASALFAALLPCPVEEVTGRGTGIDDDRLAYKIKVIKQALEVNQKRLKDPIETLAALGGFEIAGICGTILGAAAHRIPVVVDGFISSAGALVACKICPWARDFLFFSHLSAEQGHHTFFNLFCVQPILDLSMRLGEGTGAALAMSLIEAAVKIYNEMATFQEACVSGQKDG